MVNETFLASRHWCASIYVIRCRTCTLADLAKAIPRKQLPVRSCPGRMSADPAVAVEQDSVLSGNDSTAEIIRCYYATIDEPGSSTLLGRNTVKVFFFSTPRARGLFDRRRGRVHLRGGGDGLEDQDAWTASALPISQVMQARSRSELYQSIRSIS